MPALQFDHRLLSPLGVAEKCLALVPILLALSTGVVALLQVVNGLPAESILETLIVGWLLATPVAALVLWPLPDAVPVPDLGDAVARADQAEADSDDPVQRLRDRYAAGDIGQEEFERRLDDLLATEETSVGDPATGDRSSRHVSGESEPVTERE
ncbi:Short C-terminal domain-containing protein [Halomicrobium zhouii]|uniref:Short C-terminal domain-containing protein n=1 Tax=Halomicrobium zhouii TaxID=767519 RepID=A0A1I6K212_9EURY|nr:SHOCT domain-containing protein [Halomicrobium zhouii]SFR85292.1 Short C-terminal domain-containing protein [Halomicrobium zhouii]